MFKRRYFSLLYLLFYNRYKDVVHVNNIAKLSKWQLRKIFRGEDKKCVSVFLHNVIDQYHEHHKRLSNYYLETLNKLIKRAKITLNFEEEQRLFDFEEAVFSRVRAIKNLDTNYPLLPREACKAKFEVGRLYMAKGEFYPEIFSGHMLLTNQRIILANPTRVGEDQSFLLKRMQVITDEDYGVCFKYENARYILRSHNNLPLSITFFKIFKRYGPRRRSGYHNKKHQSNKLQPNS